MRKRKSKNHRHKAWEQRIVLVLFLAVVAALVISRIGAELPDGEVSIAQTQPPRDGAVFPQESVSVAVVSDAPMPEVPAPVERYAGITMTQSERNELAAIIYLEARGEPAEGQQAVAEVVLNRVIRQDFPDSIHKVLHQGEETAVPQFSTITLLETAEPTQDQYDAIDAALYGPSILPDEVVFFSMAGENDRVWGTIGGHVFCYAYIWE